MKSQREYALVDLGGSFFGGPLACKANGPFKLECIDRAGAKWSKHA